MSRKVNLTLDQKSSVYNLLDNDRRLTVSVSTDVRNAIWDTLSDEEAWEVDPGRFISETGDTSFRDRALDKKLAKINALQG